MKNTLKKIWKSKYGNLVFFLFFVSIGGFYLFMDRPSVHSNNDLIDIKGTINKIDQVLVYSKKINKTEDDSTYYIFLNEFPSKFQVSYMSYDSKDFFRTSKRGDSILLSIAIEDIDRLSIVDEKIRSFSLKVNNKTYLSPSYGLNGFGVGGFELGMIIIPILINIFVIAMILKSK